MKKYLPLLILGFFFIASRAHAAIAFVASSSFSATTAATTASTTFSTTASNLLDVTCRHGSTFVAPTSVTDSLGDTFTPIVTASDSNDGAATMYWAIAGNTSSTNKISCNFASSVTYRDINILSYSGTATTSPLDTFVKNSTGTITQKSFGSGLFTTTNAGDVIVSYGQNGSGNSMSSVTPAGMTIRTNLDSSFIGVASADWIPGSTETNQSSTWTTTTNSSWMVIVAAFKPAPVPSPSAAKLMAFEWITDD